MQHKRIIGRLLAGVLAALTIAVVGLATPAWAEGGKGTFSEPYEEYASVISGYDDGMNEIWIEVTSTSGNGPLNFNGEHSKNVTLNIILESSPKGIPILTVGSSDHPMTLNLNLMDPEDGPKATNVNAGSITVNDGSSLNIKNTAIGLKTLNMLTNGLAVNPGASLSFANTATTAGKPTTFTVKSGSPITLKGGTAAVVSGANVSIGSNVTFSAGAGITVSSGVQTDSGASKGASLTVAQGAILELGNNTITIQACTGANKVVAGSGGSVKIDGTVTTTNTSDSNVITVDAASSDELAANGGSLAIGSTATLGTNDNPIPIANSGIAETSGTIYGSITNNGSLTIKGGTITGTSVSSGQPGITATKGTVTMSGGSVIGGKNNAGIAANGGTVTITGGSITGGSDSGGAGIVTGSGSGNILVNVSGASVKGTGTNAGIDMKTTSYSGTTVSLSGTTTVEAGSGSRAIDMSAGALNIDGNCTVIAQSGHAAIGVAGGNAVISGTINPSSNGGPALILVDSGGKLTTNSGASIKNNEYPVVRVKGGRLVMEGGIIECTSAGSNSVGVEILSGGNATLNGNAVVNANQYAVQFGTGGGTLIANNNALIGSTNTGGASVNLGADSTTSTVELNGNALLKYASNAGPFAPVSPATPNSGADVSVNTPQNIGLKDKEAFDKYITDNAGYNGKIALQQPNGTINNTNPGTGGGGSVTPPGPVQPTTVTVTFNPNNGGNTWQQRGELSDNGTATFDVPSAPSYPGYYFLGWFNEGSRVSGHVTVDRNANIIARWARVNVSLQPTSQVVAPGSATTIKVTTSLFAVDSGFNPPASASATYTRLTTNPTLTPAASYSNGIISFTAPAAQPQTVTVNIFFNGANNTSGSGFATANVLVADASAVNVVSNNTYMGSVSKGSNVLDNGRITLSASPANGYEFVNWTFAPTAGTTGDPTAGINMNSMTIQVPTNAGTWTAQYQTAVQATVYRLYNPYNGAHLITSDQNEIRVLVPLGWKDEGARFTEYQNPGSAGQPVWRLYNRNNSDHFYTADYNEVQSLVAMGRGWENEGVKWYGARNSAIPVYRLYNPYMTADMGLGNHLWTISAHERATLLKLGWKNESIGWFAVRGLAA